MRGSPPRDPYATLGVGRGTDAAEIKAAYRRLAMEHHPDRNPGNPSAEEKFKELSQAYAILGDEDKRARYDHFGAAGSDLPFGGDADLGKVTEFFEGVFGDLFGSRRKRAAGQDLRYTLELDFEEAALGCEKEIRFQRKEDCETCRGTGAEGGPSGLRRCGPCEGMGQLTQGSGLFAMRRPCPDCDGEGQRPEKACKGCDGQGLAEVDRTFTVHVPPGSQQGATQRIQGQGAPGRKGGPVGDLTVLVRVRPHPFYRQEGELLLLDLPLSPMTAALGSEVDVPLMDSIVRMKIPPGTQTGAMFRLRGRGLPRGHGARGDVHVVVNIEIPMDIPTEARTHLEALASHLTNDHFPRRKAFHAATQKAREKVPT